MTTPNLPEKLSNGKYPSFTSVGCYTLVYYTDAGEEFCGDCASVWNEEQPITACGTYDEGPALQCADCGKDIENSYGDPDEADFDMFLAGYLECALWSSTDHSRDDGRDPLDDNYGPEDFAPESLLQAKNECRDFMESNAALLVKSGMEMGSAGHDFWLTRNGHGAGFWDRGLGAVGEKLSKASKVYGSVDLYVGDDGMIYGS